MKALARGVGMVFPALVLAAMAWGSRAPLRVANREAAVVRVSLGARPERIEECRAVTDDELARALPQMRQRLVCEGTTARYRLEVRRDTTLLLSRVVRGGGLRHDRQLYVFREIEVPPGEARISVSLVRIDSVTVREDEQGGTAMPQEGILADRARREVEERRRRREEAVPAELRLSETVHLRPQQVLLITYLSQERRLALVQARLESGGRSR